MNDDVYYMIREIAIILVEAITNILEVAAWIMVIVLLILTFPVWIIPYLIRRHNKKHNKNYNKTEK